MNALHECPIQWPDFDQKEPGQSSCHFSILKGPGLSIWMAGNPGQEARHDLQLKIAPDRPVIIGRAEGNKVPYLDPAYQSTTLVPGTGETILRSNGDGNDRMVSRAHFMLRAISRGIIVVNGVPHPGGGIRPPLNGTLVLVPGQRPLEPEEELVVESGEVVVLLLPNGTTIRIEAE